MDSALQRAIEGHARAYRFSMPERQRPPVAGDVAGRRTGSSIEYQDRKDYVPGDDLRHVDWRAFARSDRLTIKLYREEISPRIDIVVDTSRSMTTSPEKADAAVREHTLYLRGQIAVAREDWDQARRTFAALENEFPESPSRLVASYWVAETAYRRRDYRAAGELFDALARRTRGRQEDWLAMVPLRQAQALAQLNKWGEALVIASGIETEYPNFEQQYEADHLIGRCLATRADFQGAREAYLKVIRSPEGAKTETAAMAQWMIGETFFHQKDFATALREYLKVEILYDFPTWRAAALLQAGKCRELLGEPKEAHKLYTRLMKEYPGTRFAKDAARKMGEMPVYRGVGDQPD